MIHPAGALLFAAYFLIGPFGAHQEVSTLVSLSMLAMTLTIALLSNHASRMQSIALTSGLAILFYESLQSVTSWLQLELTEASVLGEKEALHFMSFFFTLNVGLALIGTAAAAIVAVSLEVRKTCLPLGKLLPTVSFVSPPKELTRMVSSLSRKAGITTPNVSLIDSGDPAAFITRSREGFELAVSVGLLESLSRDELEACVAHELAHVKNRDFAVRSFATSAKVALFAHPLSHLIEPALYRAREFLADRTAVQLIGQPDSLISALVKIQESQDYMALQSSSIAAACLFNTTSRNWFTRLFDKHPSLDVRIKTLRELNVR